MLPRTPGGKSLSPSSVTIYSTSHYLPMSNFSKVRRVVLPCARCLFVALRGYSGMEHILCRPELRMFSIARGAPGWGAPSFSFYTEQKAPLASAPSLGQSIVSVLNRHFGIGLHLTGLHPSWLCQLGPFRLRVVKSVSCFPCILILLCSFPFSFCALP